MDSTNSTEKKITFEELSKEELVKKCHTFLIIIQKAKQSKCLLQDEIEQLKAKLEFNKKPEVPPAIDELIQDLTQQKLKFVSSIEDLKSKNECLVTNLNQYKEEKRRLDAELNKLDSENVAYKRQITRLGDENDQLINHLESLEKQIEELNKIGLDQQQQLLKLEERNTNVQQQQQQSSNSNEQEKIQELEKMLSISLEEIKRLKSEIEKGSVKEPTENNIDVPDLIEVNNKLKEKLKFYHSKIVKLAINIKQLKQDKEIILDEFKVYTDQVRDWKDKLNVASNKLLNFVKNNQQENEELKKYNQNLKDLNTKFMEQLEAHKTDDEKSKELEEMDTLKTKNIMLLDQLEKTKENLAQVSSEYKTSLENLELQNNELKAKLEESNLKEANAIQSNMIEKQDLIEQLQQLTSDYKELSVCVTQDKENFQKDLSEKDDQISSLHVELQTIKNSVKEYITKNEELRQIVENYEASDKEQKKFILNLEQNVKNLNSELDKSITTEQQLAEKSSEEMLKLAQEVETLSQNSIKLYDRIKEFEIKEEAHKSKLIDVDVQTESEFVVHSEYSEEFLLLKNENSQLLAEMNEMNQELKERGENLSKLEAHCEEIKRKIKIYETQANLNISNITEKEEVIRKLQTEINSLKSENLNLSNQDKEDEITNLKHQIECLKEKINANFENYTESDMMSTSTISRTEELERMKDLEGSWEEKYNKLRSLAIKLKAKLRDENAELAKEKAEKIEIQRELNITNDTFKIVQSQFNQINDELEKTKKVCMEYSKKITVNDEHLNVKSGETIKLKSELENLKKDKADTEHWKKQISLKVQALRKELAEKETLLKDYESKLSKLTADLEEKDQVFKLEIENHKQTKNSLQRFTNENKKNTVLNLEMQDYEKSVKDLSQKLEKKNDHITKLKGQLDGQKSIVNSIKDQNNVLEEKMKVYESDLDNAITERSTYKKKTLELEGILQDKDEEIMNIQQQLESIRSLNEELSTELSGDIAERQKTINSLREEKEVIVLQNLNLQQISRDLQQKLTLKEQELSTITSDYENYKIRAQSVLRQNQGRDIGLEEKLSGNVFSLLSQIEVLNTEMEVLRNSNESMQTQNEDLKAEQNTLNSKYDETTKAMIEMKTQYEQLMAKYNQALNEHNETVRSLKVHAETLGQCYRQQISEQEVRHNREVIELQSKIEKSYSATEVSLPLLPTTPREEGEGSESVESVNNMPIPLEKLLGEEDDQKVNVLKKQISEQDSKLTHLTELLADTEQDLAKHVQMNKVLKEEIRRQQRAVEREKHAENLEYLKNVVFKFITLHSGDERSRLVPVLNTILKLSPEEAQKLDMVAKGDPGLKAWSSYLPMWPSPNKS